MAGRLGNLVHMSLWRQRGWVAIDTAWRSGGPV